MTLRRYIQFLGFRIFLMVAVLIIPAGVYAAKLQVVASIFPISDMARQVGGPFVDVTTLVPPGASPHTFELKPGQVKAFSNARVFLMIGAGLEFWADSLIHASGQHLTTVVLSDGMHLMTSVDPDAAEHPTPPVKPGGAASAPTDAHADLTANPHVWLDPKLAEIMVRRISQAFSAADPPHAADYEKQTQAYLAKLSALDSHIREAVSRFKIKQFISFHPSWDYFAARYGLTSDGVIEKTPGRNPTPREITDIVDIIKSHKIRAVFAEPQLNPRVADVIARESGVKVLLLDPLGESTIPGRDSYIALMLYNLRHMKEAME